MWSTAWGVELLGLLPSGRFSVAFTLGKSHMWVTANIGGFSPVYIFSRILCFSNIWESILCNAKIALL